MNTIRVLVADNYSLSRYGIVNFLRKEYEKIQISEAENFQKVDDLLSERKFHLLILGQSEVGKNNLSAIRRIRNSYAHLPILVLCIYPESTYTYKIIKAGANGYLNRNTTTANFKSAVKNLLTGKDYFSEVALKVLIEKTRKQKKSSIEELSQRELQILKLMAAGKSNQTISQETKLVRTTISTYRFRILNKLGLKNNAQLIKFALENNIA